MRRFEELDENESRILDIGVEIPSKEQVLELIQERNTYFQQNNNSDDNENKNNNNSDNNDATNNGFNTAIAKPSEFNNVWNKLEQEQEEMLLYP